MKKSIIVLIALVTLACKKENIDYAIVKGVIKNLEKKEIYLGPNLIKLKEDGSFIDTLRAHNNYIGIYDEKNVKLLYIENGSDLTISYDAKDLKNTLSFSGSAADACKYIDIKVNSDNNIKNENSEIFKLNEADFLKKFENIKAELGQKIDATNSSNTFKAQQKRLLNYSFLRKLDLYENYYKHYAKEPNFKTSEQFKNNFEKEINRLDYSLMEDLNISEDYESLLKAHYYKISDRLATKDSISQDLAFLKVVGKLENQELKNFLAYDSARNSIKYVDKLDAYYNEYMSISTEDRQKEVITNLYNKTKIVAKGMPSPEFMNYENNAGGTTSLSDFRGKYVYIDVWATWCGPCKEQIPYLEKIEKKYHGKNIEFISISVDKDKDHDSWKQMIKDKQMSGIQLLADNQFKSDFIKSYSINAIPRFILIDPNGKIVDSTAPAPERESLIDLFNTLNI